MQVQDIQDIPMEINYTITEPVNDYYSDIYSPGQTKLQLNMGLEVSPEKVKSETKSILPGPNEIPTKSRNVVVDIKAIELSTNLVSYGIMKNNINNQTCRRPNGSEGADGYVYDMGNGTKGKITRVKPGTIYIEAEGGQVNLTFTAHNISV